MYFYHEHYHDAYAAGLEDLPTVDRRKDQGAYEPLPIPAIVNWLLITGGALLVVNVAIGILS
jgi:hypothetical protein